MGGGKALQRSFCCVCIASNLHVHVNFREPEPRTTTTTPPRINLFYSLQMFCTCTLSAVRAVRSFATAKNKPFLSNAIAKAAIGKDMGVAASFVSAFAGVVHGKHVQVTDVSALPETAGVTLARVMKHDISLRYSFGGLEPKD